MWEGSEFKRKYPYFGSKEQWGVDKELWDPRKEKAIEIWLYYLSGWGSGIWAWFQKVRQLVSA
jgi:hypothetical protein